MTENDQRQKPDDSPTPRSELAKQKILIVDDKKENLVALRQVLDGVDVEIVEATTGNEALAATLSHDFAVAILDVMMPEMSGYEVAENLRRDDKTKLIPIVFVTAAYADERHMFEGYEAGGIDYIVKPYPPEVLVGKVRVLLEMDRNRRELQMHRDRLETLVAERTAKLTEGVKELTCLYAISNLVAEPCESIDEVLKAAVDLILPGWQYPEITRARIVFEGREFASKGFKGTPWKLSADIVLSGEAVGTVDVCRLEERLESDEGPFLKEERALIDDIVRQLGIMIHRKRAEQELATHREHLEELVEERTSELEAASRELRDSEERFRTVFEQSADSVVLIDAESGAIVEFNDNAHHALGYTRAELEDLTSADFEVVESAEDVATRAGKITRDGADTFETKHRTKAGEVRDILVSCRLISIRGRRFIQSIWRDTTAQKQAQEALETRTAELRKAVNLMSGREVRMAGLKKAVEQLREQLESAGMTPVADDPLRHAGRGGM